MNPYVNGFLILSLGLGTTLTLMSSHWFVAWMGLEINTLAIIPLMARRGHPRAVEAATKYFLTQATAAMLVMFAVVINAWITGEWNIQQLPDSLTSNVVMIALALKVGLAPVHFWYPEVLQGLDLTTGLILSTWQKLAPFALIYQVAPGASPVLLACLGVCSALVGGWGGLNQTQLRKLLAYSSIAHMGWMIIVVKFVPNLTVLGLGVYIVMTSATFMALKTVSATKISTLALKWAKAPGLVTLTMLTLLSLGGLPPLSGFLPKWLILHELAKQNLPLIATLMAMASLLNLFFYMRVSYVMCLTLFPGTSNTTALWRFYSTQAILPLSMALVGALMLLPVTPLIEAMTL
uniref:NADH dehydrogenase subunit 2 n=1 Tax=Albula vulpes TaxID=54909 RepID=UPI0028D73073|nr:NADH dehydrogenase subunit 2 [Albula vulpes]WMY89487.1 NADH dehydrogenase subunit 2 [Albula vulpes]